MNEEEENLKKAEENGWSTSSLPFMEQISFRIREGYFFSSTKRRGYCVSALDNPDTWEEPEDECKGT